MLKIKNGRLRPLSIGRQPLQRVREHDRLYFACVVQQYVLRADKEGMVEIPEQNFKIELHIQEGDIDPLDAFFGRPVPIRKVVQKGENEVFKLKVIEKPLRTMEEMRKNGVEVI